MADRRTEILDAALRVLAEHGMRGLTHRAVDAAAGIAPGSTSYYFRSRSALVEGCVAGCWRSTRRWRSPEVAAAPPARPRRRGWSRWRWRWRRPGGTARSPATSSASRARASRTCARRWSRAATRSGGSPPHARRRGRRRPRRGRRRARRPAGRAGVHGAGPRPRRPPAAAGRAGCAPPTRRRAVSTRAVRTRARAPSATCSGVRGRDTRRSASTSRQAVADQRAGSAQPR